LVLGSRLHVSSRVQTSRPAWIRVCAVPANACANFFRKLAFSGRGSAGFRGEIARWLKTVVVYQSYVGGHAITSSRPSIPCRRLPFRSFDISGFFWSLPSGMVSVCRIARFSLTDYSHKVEFATRIVFVLLLLSIVSTSEN